MESTQLYVLKNGKVSKYNQERENSAATSRFYQLLDPIKVSSAMIFFCYASKLNQDHSICKFFQNFIWTQSNGSTVSTCALQ